MCNDVFSSKQSELLRLFKTKQLKRINILHGSVRSGKTWISLLLWAFWVALMPKNGTYIMVAKTITSLKRNCLDLLEELVGKDNFTYSVSGKEGRLFGRQIYLEGVNDARAESKIRGMTLQGAYCDELTLFTEDFFAMLLSRLSEPGAKLFGTTNPDSPLHWFKEHYLDRSDELNILITQFLIEDNTFLDPEYVAELKKEYVGVFYERFILGKWVVAEGLIYPFFKESDCVDGTVEADEYYISCDYGTLNPCSMGLWGINYTNHTATRIKEFYYSGRAKGTQLTDQEYYKALEKLAEGYNIECVIVDPSAASFIAEIRSHDRFDVRKARNDVVEGIRTTGTLLKSGKVRIHRDCRDAITEFQTYAWDEKANEDKPIKQNDHAMDDTRYFCYTILKPMEW